MRRKIKELTDIEIQEIRELLISEKEEYKPRFLDSLIFYIEHIGILGGLIFIIMVFIFIFILKDIL